MLEGWDIHVIFVEGKSVFEIYRRSSKINEFEFSALLRIQTENSFGKRHLKFKIRMLRKLRLDLII